MIGIKDSKGFDSRQAVSWYGGNTWNPVTDYLNH